MARSDVITWLPLDRWFQIIGIHPLHANRLYSADLLPNNVCGDMFYQYSWQHSDRVGIEDIAMAIQAAEKEIAAEVGYNLIPDWTVDERLPYPQPHFPGAYNLTGLNPRGQFNSIELKHGHVISGGVRTKTLVKSGAAVVRSDNDTDGYDETCTIIVATTVTEEDELHVYYPAKNGVDAWEIRPLDSVSISGGNATITFKSWLITAANTIDIFKPEALDADAAASYETTVDVYRVYNDPQTQLQFMWENMPDLNCCGTCYACQFGTQAGCIHLREPRLGIAVPAPGSWDSDNERFDTAEWSVCRAPDQVRFWYYSGFKDNSLQRPYVQMAPYWEYAVAYYAAAKLERPVCGCSNVNQFIERWRTDVMANTDPDGVGINITPEILSNKLGTTLGAIYAWKRIHQNGIRVTK